MATTQEYIEYVCEQIEEFENVRYRKMFGEYMIYVNEKPILLVCDNTVFVKKLEEIKELMQNNECGIPYKGAKEHYILDMDEKDLCQELLPILERVTPLPKKKKK